MKYFTQITIDPGAAGAGGYHLFRLDSIYDPDSTATGHQPWGHDELSPMYGKYRVNACKMTIKAHSATNGSVPFLVGLNFRRNGTGESNFQNYIEGPQYCKYRILGGDSASDPVVISMTYRPRAFFGKSFKGQDSYTAVGSNNSTFAAYAHLFSIPAGGSGDLPAVYFTVHMEFWTEFIEPAVVGPS